MTIPNNEPAPQTEDAEVLRAKIAQLEQDKLALTGELTDNRPKLRDANEQIELLKTQLTAAVQKNDANPEDKKIEDVIRRVLGNKEQVDADKNRKAAFDQFISEHKEYSPDNDPGGVKKSALEREFGNFNLTGLVETTDFKARIEKADRLLRGSTIRETENGNEPNSSGPSSTTAIEPENSTKLSPREKEVIERNGWTEAQYLSLKTKMPGYVESLFK